ncbi:PREDICTED: membrane metallo-endopeptidase-like 1 [Wasmannia auropunctata]|uniref:membrane metallo-endopeptidase-like 1 n=1 Tax=Wasmannia auropunctata TaxID=64793 RepID=UPI0005EE295F|nr:PREDICTED: membrane metallo-endopeptidase-like 1 [Wasmannia auropunctata]
MEKTVIRRSSLERRLTVIAIFGFLLCIVLAVAIAILALNTKCNITSRTNILSTAEASNDLEISKNMIPNKMKYDDICLSPECIHIASEVIKNMNSNVHPCDDFYKFACGGFLESKIISDDKTSVSMFSIIDDDLKEQLRLSIEQQSPPNELRPFRLVKDLYKACMNKTAIKQRGLTPLLNSLRKLGGWPVLNGRRWNERDFIWKDSVYRFRRLGYSINYFIGFSVYDDWKNNSRRVISLDQASLGLSREYLLKGFYDKIVQAYYKYMVDIAIILGANPDRAHIELKESLEFEIKLANVSLPKEKRRNMTLLYNPMSVNELYTSYPSIPWWEYLNTILEPQAQLNRDEIIIVNAPSYLKDFERLISTTPKRVQANYALWRATAESVKYLTDDIRKIELKYIMELNGKKEREPRWRECIGIVSNRMDFSVGSIYVRKYFKEDAKETVLEMVNNIKQEFIKILKKVDWMDEKTRRSALEKAAAMSLHVAYPNELLDDRKLDNYYEGLELSIDNYLENIYNLSTFERNFLFSRLRQPVNKTEWINYGAPAVINAYSLLNKNSIELPAGILQGIFFNNERPRYMNYGGIGFIIGHEITHNFDDQGREFNKEGNLVDWWEPETKKRYLKKAECIIHQYGNYTAEEVGLNLNGINTQGENIADNSGTREAYYAYKEWIKRNKPEQRLPGLPYSPEQMFWISASSN